MPVKAIRSRYPGVLLEKFAYPPPPPYREKGTYLYLSNDINSVPQRGSTSKGTGRGGRYFERANSLRQEERWTAQLTPFAKVFNLIL